MIKYAISVFFATCGACNSCGIEACAAELAKANIELLTISSACRNVVGNSFYIEARMSAINDGMKLGLTYNESVSAVAAMESNIKSAATEVATDRNACIKLIGDYKIKANNIRNSQNN